MAIPVPWGVGLVTTALARPSTYVGVAKEAVNVARLVARFPLGIADATVNAMPACGDPVHDTPVLLIHGYGHNRSGWYLLDRRLRAAGFTRTHTLNYVPFVFDIPLVAAQLARRIERVCDVTGAERVHVVGHSLGGIVLRWYIQEFGGDRRVDTAVTVASPHEGTHAAALAPGRTARELRPGSWVMRRLEERARPSSVRWIAYYSNLDLFVQPSDSAMLRHPALDATNILMKDHGHLSMMVSGRLSRSIVEQLERAERSADVVPISSARRP